MKEFERRLSREEETQSILIKWKSIDEQRDAYFQR